MVVGFVRRAVELPEGTLPAYRAERTAKHHRGLVRKRVGVTYDQAKARGIVEQSIRKEAEAKNRPAADTCRPIRPSGGQERQQDSDGTVASTKPGSTAGCSRMGVTRTRASRFCPGMEARPERHRPAAGPSTRAGCADRLCPWPWTSGSGALRVIRLSRVVPIMTCPGPSALVTTLRAQEQAVVTAWRASGIHGRCARAIPTWPLTGSRRHFRRASHPAKCSQHVAQQRFQRRGMLSFSERELLNVVSSEVSNPRPSLRQLSASDEKRQALLSRTAPS